MEGKLIVEKRLEQFDMWDLGCDLDKAVATLTAYVKDVKSRYPECSSLQFSVDKDWDADGYTIWLIGKRPETDIEYNNRIDTDKANQEYRRKQYEAMKAEFEGK